jgi:hypothetical protein
MAIGDSFKSTLGTALDPLGIGRRLAGTAPDEMLDPIARGTQSQTPDYGIPDDSSIGDTARETAENVSNIDVNVPWEAKGVAGIIGLALLAVAFGQLFNINVGGGQ